MRFVYASPPQRIVFGAGRLADLGAELAQLGAHRALIVCTPRGRVQAERVEADADGRCAGIFDGAVMHVPIETARDARAAAARLGADSLVAIGGGSTIGVAKAIALERALPILAIPTTYSGSEATSVVGITEAGLKTTRKDARVLPKTVIYDPALTLDLPLQVSVPSGINAIAHAAEALYSADANPITDLMAREGIAAIARSLPRLRPWNAGDQGADAVSSREDALYGAWLCGTVLGQVGMGLHHKLCHTLGGSFNLPHAQTHTVVLPHALAFNAGAAPQAMQRIARAIGADQAAAGLFDLAKSLGAPTSLAQLGMREADLDRACELAMRDRYPNPRAIDARAIRLLLQDAYEGRRPGA